MGEIATFMLKKLFIPEVKDICPNCGEACAITDVLCPKCGKNLDEPFEQFPDSSTPLFVTRKWNIFPITGKASRIWRVLNSLILIATLAMPWDAVYSDIFIFPYKPDMVIGLKVLFYSFPIELPFIFDLDCLPCARLGLSAIGHLSLMLYAILNFIFVSLHSGSRYQILQLSLRFFVITSCLILLRIKSDLFMIAPAWGYWLACVALLSSLSLEVIELMSSKSFLNESLPNAA